MAQIGIDIQKASMPENQASTQQVLDSKSMQHGKAMHACHHCIKQGSLYTLLINAIC